MARPDEIAARGYLLCATPRTGSTFLCSLLASTGVLGRPESYFREPDEVACVTTYEALTSDPPAAVRAIADAD